MTSTPFNPNSLFDLLEGAVNYAGRNIPSYEQQGKSSEGEKLGAKYKLVSDLSVGTSVILPSGVVSKVTNLGMVNDDLIELVFSDGEAVELWSNVMVEVK